MTFGLPRAQATTRAELRDASDLATPDQVPEEGAHPLARIFEQVCDQGMAANLGRPVVHVQETATFVDRDGQPRYWLLLGEMPDGSGYLYAIQLPWGGPETERSYDTIAGAQADAGEVYRLWGDAGAWQIKRAGDSAPGEHPTRTERVEGGS